MKAKIGDRMKGYYEDRNRTYLTRRIPVVLRIDGRAFHTFTKGLKKPFDSIFMNSMIDTTLELCKNIQGCVIGYTQSDEISLVLQDDKTFVTDAWFDYNVQKMCSIAASMATTYFNRSFERYVKMYMLGRPANEYTAVLRSKVNADKFFDCRCFNIPVEEVTNYIYWRQIDARRNSVASCAQSLYSQKELHGKGTPAQIEMIMEKDFMWEELPSYQKWGTLCYKMLDEPSGREFWTENLSIPLLIGADRSIVDSRISFSEEE